MQKNEYKLSSELRGHTEDVRTVLTSPLGIFSSSRDKSIKLWSPSTDSLSFQDDLTFVGHRDYVGPLLYLKPSQPTTAPCSSLSFIASPSSSTALPPASSPYDASDVFSTDFLDSANDVAPGGLLVSGSRDKRLLVWSASSAEQLLELEGHTEQVTCLCVLPSGAVVSGSLDGTLMVWRGSNRIATLKGHKGPVLSLISLEPDSADQAPVIVSGGGDRSLRWWSYKNGNEGALECVRVIEGAHDDSVRCLAVLPGECGFVSGGHDSFCRTWSNDGVPGPLLIGHTALVFGIAAAKTQQVDGSDGEDRNGGDKKRGAMVVVASCSDDNSCRIWNSSTGKCLQTLPHPGAVWSAAFLPARPSDSSVPAPPDLVTACADGVVRVWSYDPSRQACPSALAAYDTFLAEWQSSRSYSDPQQSGGAAGAAADVAGGCGSGSQAMEPSVSLPPGIKVEDPAALEQPGRRDGEQKFIRPSQGGGAIDVYVWGGGESGWERIGQVVEGPSGRGGGGGGGGGGGEGGRGSGRGPLQGQSRWRGEC
uniref:Uncharacterized protein n=1 Tax=Polytomella parva TaxID=51329 RepID=A0A6U0YXN7_9CHLO|mmetsp:Transcript_6848/g.13458  ORF Transcript_6848/g.13458 Transcript_6848/m.13458 type:complete len:535 (+) Transcript_6848:19-1623(+)